MCCNVLQCVAMCCSVLQCVAVCCNVLQCAAMCTDGYRECHKQNRYTFAMSQCVPILLMTVTPRWLWLVGSIK